ncbi:HPr kinase/phosphorylase [Jannaschia sp. 2305UL9-9]|uniref:HPr kinase/phosphorylase n=1 Tax=Jannaschia sp. 2305UL9-9 TaxID=3121638 RepID=UPI003528A679
MGREHSPDRGGHHVRAARRAFCRGPADLTGPQSICALHPVGHGILSVHGTAVAIAGQGVLIVGPSGAGKSGLAAQLIVQGGGLVCDDMVYLRDAGETLMASAPPNAPSLLELRGIGLVPQPLVPAAALALVVSLTASSTRLPQSATFDALGHRCPLVRHPYRFDLAAKVLLWLRSLENGAIADGSRRE